MMIERCQGKRYSVYNRITGQPIYIYGTGPQCAAAMGITLSAFYALKSRARLRPSKKYEFYDDQEMEDDDL